LGVEQLEALVARARRLAGVKGEGEGAALQQAAELIRQVAPDLPPPLRPAAARILRTAGFYEEADRLGDLAELGRICALEAQPGGLIQQFPRVRTDADRLELMRLHRLWGERAEARAAAQPIVRAPRAGGERLRLGVLSSDLRQHVVGHLAYPIFRWPDPRFELFAYDPSQAAPDAPQQWFASRVTRFTTLPPDDREAAQVIAADGLDALIDLGGPSAANRPAILAWRPAPLQVSWLGYPHALGLSAIDGIVLDGGMVPPSPELLLEAPLRLPGPWFAMSAAAFQPEPALPPDPPAGRRGHVTFATANNPYKFNPDLLRTWARVVAAVPGSKFRVIRFEAGAPALRENIARHFAAEGVSADRLEFPAIPGSHRSLYDEVDIALDTFPMSGGMTTCEALWMGVPTVALMGEAVFERTSGALMAGIGLGDLVATSAADYIRVAVDLAGDTPHLAELRRTMRERIAAHPLGQPEAFARGFYDLIAGAIAARAQAR
jgi:predicted O-linked N-acetylglucosamine transferase (SPINDLY family)